ncbi:Fc.00g055440.m01.CDS01 [Cosmosporella sp. VM-42]
MRSTAAFSLVAAALTGVSSACSTPGNYIVTFYGYPDNDPPGPATAYNCGGRNYKAGGSGTYSDPLTIATAPGELNACEIVYLPLLTKYARVEDSCAQCAIDWGNGQPHIDIWTGSNSVNGGQNQINCENRLTSGGRFSIVRNPPTNYGVDTTPLFVAPNTCNTNHVYPGNPAHC